MSAYTAIASQTLGSSAASVTFSSIPGTFRDLVLVADYSATASGSNNAGLRVNGDTSTSNYQTVWMAGNGASTASFTIGNLSYFKTNWSLNVVSGFKWTSIMQVFDYAQTDKHKSILYRNNVAESGGGETTAVAGRWVSTSAVTSLTFLASAIDFPAGSTFSLYGVSA